MKKPELLVPAGNLDKLKVGLQYGADAFYLGLPSFSMRSRANNFDEESLLEGIDLIRKAGKKFYMTINIYPRGNKVDAFKKHIEFIRTEVEPDALIVADPGIFDMICEYYPDAEIHMSVQANILNYRSVKFWWNRGAQRVILPRELMLSEIEEIHDKVPGMDLETFVHGAICVAYSGRCLLSTYMTGRDANQGICAHSCRWKYRLEEEKRPGEYMPIEEDGHGTYIFNSKDMCVLPHLKELVDAGVKSFKVEGRNKTEHYLATVTKAYRKAIDDMMEGKDFDENLLVEVSKTANRGFIPGFLFGFPYAGAVQATAGAGQATAGAGQAGNDDIYYEKNAPIQTHKFIGIVKHRKQQGLYEVEIRNRLEKGQTVEIMTPDGQFESKVEEIFDLEHKPVDTAHGGAGNKLLKLNEDFPKNSMLRLKV